MKPLVNSGDLVDKLIYEAYKNTPLESSEKFRKRVQNDYGVIPSFNLYREIINYQVETYGGTLSLVFREYNKCFLQYSRKQRERNVDRNNRKWAAIRNLERIENESKRIEGTTKEENS